MCDGNPAGKGCRRWLFLGQQLWSNGVGQEECCRSGYWQKGADVFMLTVLVAVFLAFWYGVLFRHNGFLVFA
jgi:hypothetical protein